MKSVADVLARGFARSWHEAVAIVQEAGSQLAPGQAVPAPDDLLLGDDGALTFGFGNETAEHPVASLARLLQQLLEGTDPPAGLRDLAFENARPEPAHATVQGFARALAFFERPNRTNDLLAITSRLPKAPTPEEELERLRRRLAEEPPKADAAPPETDEAPQKLARRALSIRVSRRTLAMGGGAVAVAVLLMAVMTFAGAPAPARTSQTSSAPALKAAPPPQAAPAPQAGPPQAAPAPQAAPVSPELSPIRRVLSAGLDLFRGGPSSAPVAATAEPAVTAPDPAPEEPRGRRSSKKSPTVERRPPARPTPHDARLPLPTVGRVASDAAPASPPDGASVDPNHVYSRADVEVAPPMLIRPQLPSHPSPDSETGYFDLLINEQGVVEQVRLVSTTHPYRERMLVAAAKAWLFRPARLRNQSVKYRLLVPVIVPQP